MKDKEIIKKICKPYSFEKYEKIDLNSLAAYTIQFLQDNNIFLNFENTAVALFLMFPKKFCMVEYEEYPDTNRINRTVNLQLRPRYQNLAYGDPKKGYSLTEKGRTIANFVKEVLNSPESGLNFKKSNIEDDTSKRTRTPKIEIEKIVISSDLFKKYKIDKNALVEKIEIYDFFQSSPYTPPKMFKEKLKFLKNLAISEENNEVVEFLDWVEKILLPKIVVGKND